VAGDDDVLDGPHGLEARLFGGVREGGRPVGVGEGAGVGEGDAELHGCRSPQVRISTGRLTSAKKSLPLASTTMNAGKASTSMRQTASMPSSGYSSTSTLRMQSCARRAAGPPIEPR